MTLHVAFRLLVLAGLALGAAPVSAQSDATPRRHAAYLELLGNGGLFSLNYERRVSPEVALRAGVGAWSGDDLFGAGEVSMVTVPLTASRIGGRGANHLELGGGVLLGRKTFTAVEEFGGDESSENFASLTGILGYRRQAPGARTVFRIAFTPFLSLTGDESTAYPDKGLFPSVGVALGFAF